MRPKRAAASAESLPVGEFELIRRYFAAAACAQAAAGVALGIGDDCALLELPRITSYNVCYTKLLRFEDAPGFLRAEGAAHVRRVD